MRLDIACLKRDNDELKAKLAAAEADLALERHENDRWEQVCDEQDAEIARLRKLCEPVAMTDEEQKFYDDAGLEE
jgi:multidrug resistance efflux pump